MAQGIVFVCSTCAHEVEAWDEGEPYYFDAQGEKRYAFHPDPERALCTGLEISGLCLRCGAEVLSDEAAPPAPCPQCGQGEVVDACALDGRTCPFCKAGTFHADPDALRVS